MKAALLFSLVFIGFLPQTFADNDDILRNSQELLEQARKKDEERRNQTLNVDIFNPPKKPDRSPAAIESINVKTQEDLLKLMQREYESTTNKKSN